MTENDSADALRREFEPLLISPYGCHLNADLCRRYWNSDRWSDLAGEVACATAWLAGAAHTKRVNGRAGTSYGLKHKAERWGKKNGLAGYVMNGCFLMAAKRGGFLIEPHEARYAGTPEGGKGSTWDCHNAYINISLRHRPL
jgi:hypothetical protein